VTPGHYGVTHTTDLCEALPEKVADGGFGWSDAADLGGAGEEKVGAQNSSQPASTASAVNMPTETGWKRTPINYLHIEDVCSKKNGLKPYIGPSLLLRADMRGFAIVALKVNQERAGSLGPFSILCVCFANMCTSWIHFLNGDFSFLKRVVDPFSI
jgi:hypothetical protein